MNRHLIVSLLVVAPWLLVAQQPRAPITNADVVSMTKSGLGEQTIVLAIQQGSTNFDTSPQTLVELKKAGVADAVLNAMLSAPKPAGSSRLTLTSGQQDPLKLLDKSLDAIGPRERLTSIKTVRYTAKQTQSGPSGVISLDFERVTSYPDRVYVLRTSTVGPATSNKLVLTPEFNYIASGKMITAIPATTLETIRTGLDFESAFIAQHIADFHLSYEGSEDLNGEAVDKLRLKNSGGKETVWSIDQIGRVRRTMRNDGSGEVVTDLSDYRLVDGVTIPFKRHVVENGVVYDYILSQYQVNPVMDGAWFSPPTGRPAAGLRIKVLQEQSVPYVQQSGGGVSTTCNIAGSANTSMNATTMGNYTFGNANTNLGLTMRCNSYDTTVRWPHVLNAMFVEASDGNAYIIACDRAWRWSKCVPLRAGEIFNAELTNKGMAVQAYNTKGQESEPTYTIIQSRSLR